MSGPLGSDYAAAGSCHFSIINHGGASSSNTRCARPTVFGSYGAAISFRCVRRCLDELSVKILMRRLLSAENKKPLPVGPARGLHSSAVSSRPPLRPFYEFGKLSDDGLIGLFKVIFWIGGDEYRIFLFSTMAWLCKLQAREMPLQSFSHGEERGQRESS